MLVGVQSQLKNVFIVETLPGFSFNFVPFRRLTVNNSIVIPAGSALKKPIQQQCRTPSQPRISQQHIVLPHGSQGRVPSDRDHLKGLAQAGRAIARVTGAGSSTGWRTALQQGPYKRKPLRPPNCPSRFGRHKTSEL